MKLIIMIKNICVKPWYISMCLLVLLSIPNSDVSAQECSDKIIEAAALYDLGQFNEVITLITPCSDSANDQTDRWRSCRGLSIGSLAASSGWSVVTRAVYECRRRRPHGN